MALQTPKSTNKGPAESQTPAPKVTDEMNNGTPELSFVDTKIPDSKELAAQKNPFLPKVKELSSKPDTASYVDLNSDRVDWARTQIRNACTSIGKGARTKVLPVEGQPGVKRVLFYVVTKTDRKDS